MCTETIWEMADGSDYGARLAMDLGYVPVYLRYNSGLAIAENGERLSTALDAFAAAYPVPIEELVPVGYSMGGLVVRSACHEASLGKRGWLSLVHRAIYVGTPHLGAPLERMGRTVARLPRAIDDRVHAPRGRARRNLRSDGVKDLGDANLRHEDWAPRPRASGCATRDIRFRSCPRSGALPRRRVVRGRRLSCGPRGALRGRARATAQRHRRARRPDERRATAQPREDLRRAKPHDARA